MPSQSTPHDAEPEHAPAPADFLTDPAGVAAVLWRGRRVASVCVIVGLLIAGLYLVQAKRLYQATAKLLVREHGVVPLGAAGGGVARLGGGGEDDIPTHAALVGSPVVVRRAVEAIGLNNLPSLGATDLDSAALAVAQELTVTRPDRQAKILQIAYLSRSRVEAVRVVRAVADSYQAFLDEVYAEGNGEVVVLMSRARDDLSRELKALEASYLEFRQKTTHLTGVGGDARPFVHQRVDEWDKAAREAMVRAVKLKAQLALGRELARDGAGLWSIAHALDQIGGPGDGPGLRTQAPGPSPPSEYLRILSGEQQRMAEKLGAQSTKVKEIDEQIAQLLADARRSRGRLEEAEVRDLLSSVEKGLKSIEALRTDLRTRFDQDMMQAKSAEIDLLTDANFKSELDRQRKLFDSVVEQLKRATLVGDYAGTRAQIVEAPNAAESPVRPRVSLTLMMGLAAGALLGVAAALGSELVDPRIRSAADAGRVSRLSVLGPVPFEATPGASPVCRTLPRSPTAEAYRVIRAHLDLARRGRDVRVILITGPLGAEGTSTVAVNLAVAFAQAGRRTLLVDADLRDPRQHEILGLSRDRGLVHLLRGLLPLARVAQTTAVKNLDLVASGPQVADPAELLSSTGLAEALETFRQAYDTVIVDAPALRGVADAALLGALADGIVLVVRVPATTRADTMRAVEALRGLGTPILGLVVNGSEPEPSLWPWPWPATTRREPASGAALGEIPYDPQVSFDPGVMVATNGFRSADSLFPMSPEGTAR